MRSMNIRLLTICFLGVIASSMSGGAQATVTSLIATVDKNPVMLDEAFQLMITATGEVDNDQLDFSALDKEFNRSRTSISRSTQSINFSTTKTTTWTTQVFPKQTGRFTIPAFTIDGQSTQSFDILVLPVSSGQGTQAREFYVTTEVNKQTVYLQQQIKYTVKLHLAADIQRGSLQSPELAGAVVQQIGEDKEYQEILNGVRYRIIERNFAIIPQSSGTFSISGPIFQGEVITDSRQGFGFFNRTKAINRSGPRQEITVKPIPSDYSEHWLPSEFVQLSEEWQGDDSNFVVGEPITRTLTLVAVGLVEEQLPEIDAFYPPDFKTYPDQAETASAQKDNLLIAQRVENVAIIPNKAGRYVLPEVVVPWFNVLTETTEFAKLPARTVNVTAPVNAGAQNLAPPVQRNLETLNTQNQQTGDSPVREAANLTNLASLDKLHWSLLAAIVVLLIAVVALVAVLATLTTRRTVAKNKNTLSKVATGDEEWQKLSHAVSNKEVALTQRYLLAWLQGNTKQTQHSVVNILESLQCSALISHYNNMVASKHSNNASTEWEPSKMQAELIALKTSFAQQQSLSAAQKLYEKK